MIDNVFTWLINLPEFWRQVVMLGCFSVPVLMSFLMMGLK